MEMSRFTRTLRVRRRCTTVPKFVGFVFCGYDDKGNLYLSASNGEYGNQLQLARLASGSGSFELIDLNAKLYTGFLFGSSVQWDGKHMTVSSDHNPQHEAVSVYRLSISGSSARVIGTTSLSSRKERHAGQSWIEGNTILGVDGKGYRSVSFWTYPKGGRPRQSIAKIGNEPVEYLWGVTVSIAPSNSHVQK